MRFIQCGDETDIKFCIDDRFCKICLWTYYSEACLITIVRSIFIVAVAFKIIKRKQFNSLSWLAKVSFIGFMVSAIVDIVYTSFLFLEKDLTCLEATLGATVNFIFMQNHWLFGVHFLRMACLLRLLFNGYSKSDLKIM